MAPSLGGVASVAGIPAWQLEPQPGEELDEEEQEKQQEEEQEVEEAGSGSQSGQASSTSEIELLQPESQETSSEEGQ